MISALILAVAITGQTASQPGPARHWVAGMVDGKSTWLWGWTNTDGSVGFYRNENPQVFSKPAAVAPRPKPQPIGAGLTLESNGTINAGLDLHATKPTGVIETNDPELAAKLEANCPNEPEPDPDIPIPPDPEEDKTELFAFLALGIGVLAWLLLSNND